MNLLEATFIDGVRGPLFSLHRPSLLTGSRDECLVIIPSFAEEMNRCRYMCTLLSQSIAQAGIGTLTVDPYGSGDSAGDFVEADWKTWQSDIEAACRHARDLGYKRISLLAIRLGALLAMDAMPLLGEVSRLVFWQPVLNGKSALTQFLRIRIAASLDREEDGGTVAGFEKEIMQGKPVQVAGYDVSPGLFSGIHASRLDQHLDYQQSEIYWLNTLASEERKTPRAETSLMEKWRSNGACIDFRTVIGPAYWAVHDRTLAPRLITATHQCLTGAGE